MAWICVRVLQILLEWLKFAFKCFKFALELFELSNDSNVFEWLKFAFEWFKFAIECFESHSNGSNLHSCGSNLHPNAWNSIRMLGISIWVVQICIPMLRILFELLTFASSGSKITFEWFESLSNGSNLHLSGSNLHSNGSNPVRMARICM